MMLQVFGYLSGLLSAMGYVPYIRDILLNKTKPQRASWFIWTVLSAITAASQLAKGAGNSLFLPIVFTLGNLIIVLLSIKRGVGGFSKSDIASLLLAGLGIGLWFITKEASFALLITIAVNTVGWALTMKKSLINPESETLSTWLLSSIAGLFSALSVGSMNFILLLYPVYIFIFNALMVVAIKIGRTR